MISFIWFLLNFRVFLDIYDWENFSIMIASIWILSNAWSHVILRYLVLEKTLSRKLHLYGFSSSMCLQKTIWVSFIEKTLLYWLHLHGFSLVCNPMSSLRYPVFVFFLQTSIRVLFCKDLNKKVYEHRVLEILFYFKKSYPQILSHVSTAFKKWK